MTNDFDPALWQERIHERVIQFTSDTGHVNVAFDKHAGIYRLETGHDDFEAAFARLADSWKSDRPVDVILEGNRISSVGPVEGD